MDAKAGKAGGESGFVQQDLHSDVHQSMGQPKDAKTPIRKKDRESINSWGKRLKDYHPVSSPFPQLHPKVGCLIMSGAGGKAFCAGGDVQMIREELSYIVRKVFRLLTGFCLFFWLVGLLGGAGWLPASLPSCLASWLVGWLVVLCQTGFISLRSFHEDVLLRRDSVEGRFLRFSSTKSMR